MIYTTTPTETEARQIGRSLVEERSVACVNIVPKMRSIYRWKGVLEEADEFIMIAKTTMDRVEEIKSTILELHSYELPCLVVLPVVSGLERYLQWIVDETRK